MSEFLPFYKELWSDKKFRKLPYSDHRIVYLYLFFNPHMTLTGIFEIDIDECKLKTCMKANFNEIFKEVVSGKYNIEYDEKDEIVFVLNRFSRIPTKSPKVIVGAIEELNLISHPFKQKFIEKYKDILLPFMFRLRGHEVKKQEYSQEEFIVNASKIYNTKESLKRFICSKGVTEERVDEVIKRILINLK